MNKRTKNFILLIAFIQIGGIIGLLALPPVVQAIPGRYRVALAERIPLLSGLVEGVIDQVAPVAHLPAPVTETNVNTAVNLTDLIASDPSASDLIAAEPTATMAVATPTSAATTTTAAVEETVIAPPTATPTQTPTPSPTATPTPEPLPLQVTLEGMGVIRQTFNNCGPANLTQVLNFKGYNITQTDVADYLKPNAEDRNVSPWQIADYVNEQTPYRAIARSNGDLEMIKQFVAAGFPVVVEKGYELDSGWWGHYLTIFGYDDETETFYSQDSYLGPWDGSGRSDSYEEINTFWQQFNFTFYVVYESAQEEVVHAILGEDMLDDFTMWQQTAARAEAFTRSDPEDAFAWFNLGTSLTRMGELTGDERYYQGGAQAFDQALTIGLPPRMLWYQFRPYFAYLKLGRFDDMLNLAEATLSTQGGRNVEETYWHQGHALAAQGNITGARAAYESALEINPNFYPAQTSLDWINSL